jgi:DNA-directed RNA polymerase subunit RPC12/RpoP
LESITIGEIVLELDDLKVKDPQDFEDSKDIWSTPLRGVCNICGNLTNDQLHAIMKEKYVFCDKCGYNLVVFLRGHGFESDTYFAYVDYLKQEYRNKIKGLEESFNGVPGKPMGVFNGQASNQN